MIKKFNFALWFSYQVLMTSYFLNVLILESRQYHSSFSTNLPSLYFTYVQAVIFILFIQEVGPVYFWTLNIFCSILRIISYIATVIWHQFLWYLKTSKGKD